MRKGNPPAVLVSVTLHSHPKLVGLPSPDARAGWYVVLTRAKEQRPAGEFGSRAVLAYVLSRHARFISDYLTAALLHEAPFDCEECFEEAPQWRDLKAGVLVVHDWHGHQSQALSDAERTAKSRAARGITSGHGDTAGTRRGHGGDTAGERDGDTAGTRPGHNRLARGVHVPVQGTGKNGATSTEGARPPAREGPQRRGGGPERVGALLQGEAAKYEKEPTPDGWRYTDPARHLEALAQAEQDALAEAALP